MKKALLIITSICIALGMNATENIVKAENDNILEDLTAGYIEYTDSLCPEDALSIAYDGPITEGDNQITKRVILDALQYGKDHSKGGELTQKDYSRSQYEEWTLISQEVLRSYGVIKGHYLRKVPAGMNYGSTTVSFQVSGVVHGITLSASVTFNATASYIGPTGTELICTGTYATHRYFSQLGSGKIVRNTYSVLDLVTGETRTEIITLVMDQSSTVYSNLAYYNANTGYVTLRSVSSSNYSYRLESTWISYVNSQYPWSYISF